ncbi:MAG: NUDIX domain-containing protein [Paludibacteraceae bacterium]|jgi:NAD+ diphosphatase
MEFCTKCGNALELRACAGEENFIPFCTKCNEYRFPMFNVAICTALFNKDRSKILMMRQYGREKYNFLAGYVNKGEDAEHALFREMQEEMNMTPDSVEFLYTVYFQKSNTLMLNFLTTVKDESLAGASSNEVDEVHWFNYEEAYEAVIKGSLAEKLLKTVKPLFVV